MITNIFFHYSNLITYMVIFGWRLHPEVVWKTVITFQDILVIYKEIWHAEHPDIFYQKLSELQGTEAIPGK